MVEWMATRQDRDVHETRPGLEEILRNKLGCIGTWVDHHPSIDHVMEMAVVGVAGVRARSEQVQPVRQASGHQERHGGVQRYRVESDPPPAFLP